MEYFSKLNNKLAFMAVCLGLCLNTTSCTDKEDAIKIVEPGIYYIETNLTPSLETRGVLDNHDFDSNYDPDYIYLHAIDSDNYLELPVYDNCPNSEGGTCKGFRYRMVVEEDGKATITPIDSNGEYLETSITLDANQTCYFSSWSSDNWALEKGQISNEQWPSDPDNKYYFYYRDKNVNQEIYRSESNLEISDLQKNGDLTIVRACAGFNVLGLFYDSNSKSDFGNGTTYNMSEETFEKIMGSSPDDWYIKIYIGGSCYPDQYNIETNTATNSYPNGYYSSGDGDKFEGGQLDNQQYLPFSPNQYGTGSVTYQSYGYYTKTGNQLFTPVAGQSEVNVYILVKHWTQENDPDGEPGSPSSDWLKSDIGALQTTMVSDGKISPQNNNFYSLGLIMDLTQFKAAWDANGGDNYSSSSTTRSLSGAPVREFKLENAKVICDVY